jgi:TPR repeat protein
MGPNESRADEKLAADERLVLAVLGRLASNRRSKTDLAWLLVASEDDPEAGAAEALRLGLGDSDTANDRTNLKLVPQVSQQTESSAGRVHTPTARAGAESWRMRLRQIGSLAAAACVGLLVGVVAMWLYGSHGPTWQGLTQSHVGQDARDQKLTELTAVVEGIQDPATRSDARRALEAMLSGGVGGTEKTEESFRWFRRAAQDGVPEAQYAVALMYLEGWGNARDVEAARLWLSEVSRSLQASPELVSKAREALLRIGKSSSDGR